MITLASYSEYNVSFRSRRKPENQMKSSLFTQNAEQQAFFKSHVFQSKKKTNDQELIP